MANFYAVFDRQRQGASEGSSEKEFKSAKLLPQAPPHFNVEVARVVKLEAGSVAEAQEAIANWFPGQNSGTPVIITEAAYKES